MALAKVPGLVDAMASQRRTFCGPRIPSVGSPHRHHVVMQARASASFHATNLFHCGERRASRVARVAISGDGGRVSQAPAKVPITFHFGETSLTLPFSVEAARSLSNSITSLLATFKEKEKATRPQRWQSLEYRESGEDGVYFELFCNPNAYANAFQAKVLVTINDEKIRVASEGQLSAVKADLDQYLDAHS
eukprot:TRINITY_DN18786_c0_g1_i1.p1 TRINITY_DN18786_c0_g1~~TRINITY_DN18786_c0_g1_i1.p1  ORF type:complete len:192 (-),score=32.43 TRINITY_DN18786_c0_g1_i1:164-739(-)